MRVFVAAAALVAVSGPLRLDTPADRDAFRRWFCYIAETEFYRNAPLPEVNDCAALVRYALREALRPHTPEWRRLFGAPRALFAPDVRAFQFPKTPFGPRVFETASDHSEFADAVTLRDYNTRLSGRKPESALTGDLLFFYQPDQKQPFHLMIFLGRSAYGDPGDDWIVYHTGPPDNLIKKVNRRDLERHPEPRWRPVPHNPAFLGYYRLSLLAER